MSIFSRYCYALAALVVLIGWLDHTSSTRDWSVSELTVVVIPVALLTVAGSSLAWLSAQLRQRLRDRKAKTLPGHFYDCLEGSEFAEIQPRYVIYLRPFATTGRLTLRNPKRGWLPFTPSYFENRKNIELETAFAAALEPVIPVVGLGRAGEHVGVGHIETSDQGWWDLFCTLVDGAEWILMLPAWKGETRRELEYVRSPRLLHKTVFVMPPRLSGSQIDMPSYWDTLQDQAREIELRLPDYTPVGELFTLGNNGTVRRLRPIGRPTEERLRDAFLSITREHRVSV